MVIIQDDTSSGFSVNLADSALLEVAAEKVTALCAKPILTLQEQRFVKGVEICVTDHVVWYEHEVRESRDARNVSMSGS